MGGYDGGVEVGFNGHWSEERFSALLALFESARKVSETVKTDDRFVTLGRRQFLVHPHGANAGAHYKYVLEGGGIKVYVHANPKGPIQAVRVRYGSEALTGRDVFAVHHDFLELLSLLGFYVEKETVIRKRFRRQSRMTGLPAFILPGL